MSQHYKPVDRWRKPNWIYWQKCSWLFKECFHVEIDRMQHGFIVMHYNNSLWISFNMLVPLNLASSTESFSLNLVQLYYCKFIVIHFLKSVRHKQKTYIRAYLYSLRKLMEMSWKIISRERVIKRHDAKENGKMESEKIQRKEKEETENKKKRRNNILYCWSDVHISSCTTHLSLTQHNGLLLVLLHFLAHMSISSTTKTITAYLTRIYLHS